MDKFNARFPRYNDDTDFTTNSPSYYEYLARINKLIKVLAEKIGYYDEELSKRFEEWDKLISEFPDEVMKLLNEWLEDGTLSREMIDFLLPTHVYTYGTVKEMQDDKTLKEGSFCRTLGYYEIGDGGGAYYIIQDVEAEQHIKVNGFYAKNISLNKNIIMYGADKNGKEDSLKAFNLGFKDTDVLYVPIGEFLVSDTIQVIGGKVLKGVTENVRNLGKTATIKYIGEKNEYKTVILLGRNTVNTIPSISNSNVKLYNIRIDCNKLAGFGVYGTYISGESVVQNVVAQNATEYGMYFARSWYLKLHDLVSLNSDYNGIAIGMPLMYSDGRTIEWIGSSTEMNMVDINNLRSSRSGERYENILWNKGNITDLLGGYGVGIGVGNGITPSNITSEHSGGINLVIYTESQPMKSITNAYIERTNSFLTESNDNKIGILFYFSKEKRGDTGGSVYLKDVFVNPSNGGNITISGISGRDIHLENILQPVGIRTFNYEIDESLPKLYHVRAKNISNYTFNYNPKDQYEILRKVINTSGQWDDIIFNSNSDTLGIYGRKLSDDVTPIDYLSFYDRNNERIDIPLDSIDSTEFKLIGRVPFGFKKKIFRGGSTSLDEENKIELIFVKSNAR